MRLLMDAGLPIASDIVGAGGVIAWLSQVQPGAFLQVESEIIQLRRSRSHPPRGSGRR
jgi:hypothetical protein